VDEGAVVVADIDEEVEAGSLVSFYFRVGQFFLMQRWRFRSLAMRTAILGISYHIFIMITCFESGENT
jgi:hypothetical protein